MTTDEFITGEGLTCISLDMPRGSAFTIRRAQRYSSALRRVRVIRVTVRTLYLTNVPFECEYIDISAPDVLVERWTAMRAQDEAFDEAVGWHLLRTAETALRRAGIHCALQG
jgi:hypothetical protein